MLWRLDPSQNQAEPPPKKHCILGCVPKAQNRPVGAYGMPKMAKIPAFASLFYAFFKPGEKSENCAPAHAGVRFSRLRGTLKASIFDAFSESARSSPPEGTSRRTVWKFCRFGELFRACFGSFFRTVALPTAPRESRGTLLGQSWGMFGAPSYFLTTKMSP